MGLLAAQTMDLDQIADIAFTSPPTPSRGPAQRESLFVFAALLYAKRNTHKRLAVRIALFLRSLKRTTS